MRNTSNFEDLVEVIVYFNESLTDSTLLFVPKSLNDEEIKQTVYEAYGEHFKYVKQ